MNLTDQKITGKGEVYIKDSLSAALLEMKISVLEDTIIPNTNELIIYVDTSEESNPTIERKQYVFELSNRLGRCSNVSDEFVVEMSYEKNEVIMKTFVERNVGINGVLNEPSIEILANIPITLFEGENFVYTNYENVQIELVYPENDDLNKRFLSTATYYGRKNQTLESGSIDYENICDLIYPVESIYFAVNNINPTTIFGGIWEEWGAGCVPVGVDINQTEFNAVEKPGGSKFLQQHNHPQGGSISSTGGHSHTVPNKQVPNNTTATPTVFESWPGGGTGGRVHATSTDGAHTHTLSGNTGNAGTGEAGNLPPYMTCYMWKRTA